MIENLNQEIESINSNISVLPKNNKKNLEKYNAYIDEILAKYKPMLEESERIIKARYQDTLSKYKNLTFSLEDDSMDYNSLKLSDERVFSSEKMNLEYLLYKLDTSSNNLDEVNEILLKILENFESCGIVLTVDDFNHTESVNLYMKALFDKSTGIIEVFNELFWKDPELIKEIELNIKYLYYKNESKINDYYKNKYADFDFHSFITNHRNIVLRNELSKHKSVKYIYDLFMNGELELDDFIIESRVQDLISLFLSDPSSERNYDNLIELNKSLVEFSGYLKYKFIIDNFKELFSHKEEYKDLFTNKLKEIAKMEHDLFAINKKINKTGLFKLNKIKLSDAKIERNRIIGELLNQYKELDDLKIKEVINKYVTSETNCYDVLKFATYNFHYFISLLESDNEAITIENIENNLHELQKFIYDNNIDIIDNINLSEEKDVAKMISERYKLNSILVNEDKLNVNGLKDLLFGVKKLLIYFDIYILMINLKDLRFLIDAPKALGKQD